MQRSDQRGAGHGGLMGDQGVRAGFLNTISNTLVSVELQTGMRANRSRRVSPRRVVLKASITSVILLSIAFIITYSVLLTYVTNRVPMMRPGSSSSEKSKYGKRTKLIARPFEVFGHKHKIQLTDDVVVKWHIEAFDDVITQKPACQAGNSVTILITSSPENHDQRNAIRNTWCRIPSGSSSPFQCIFLIGQTFHRPSLILIEKEIVIHHDILIGSYVDSYRNLTVKTMHGLHWVSKLCPSDYVLKTDDDVFVNIKVLRQLIEHNAPKNNTYMGKVLNDSYRLKVVRNPSSKWHVTEEEYEHSHYPPYVVGMGYLMSSDVVSNIVNVSQYVKPFANEDAYVGVLVNKLKVQPLKSGRFTLSSSGLRTCNFIYVIIVHHVSPSEQFRLFEASEEAFRTCDLNSTENGHSWL